MTIQEKINEVAGQVEELAKLASETRKTARAAKNTKSAKSAGAKSVKNTLEAAAEMPADGELARAAQGVRQLGHEWMETNAHARAAAVVLGLVEEDYDPKLATMFIRECVQFRQYGELKRKENSGTALLFRMLTMPEYAALVQLLLEESGSLGYVPEDGTAPEMAADGK